MNKIDCSLRAYANEFSHELNQCLKNNSAVLSHTGEAVCVTTAALEVLTKMRAKCSARNESPDCTLGGYVDAVFEEFDLERKVLEIGFGKVVNVIEKKLGGILPPSQEVAYVTLGGCAVGGLLGGLGGAASTPALPILGGGFGLVKGCEHGVKVGMGLYGLWQISVKVGGVYEATGTAIQALGSHSQACAAKPLLPEISHPEAPTPTNTPLTTALKSPAVDKRQSAPTRPNIPHSFPIPKAFSPLPNIEPTIPEISLTPILTPTKAEPTFEWIDIEDTAEKIVDIAQELTGVTSTVHQVKELKALFVSILSSPENGSKLLVGQLLKEPERILQRIVNSPKEFLTNTETFLSDPTLSGVVSVIGAAFTIISVANEILPIATKIRQDAFKNPIALPVTITKELGKLTANKIVGIVKLAEGLLKDPIKTTSAFAKGMIKSPETLLKNVKSFVGLHKNKAKRRAKKLQRLQEAAESRIRADSKRTIQEIIAILPACYSMAKKQWMISETLSPEKYLAATVEDWKIANADQKFHGSCGAFLQMIHFFLVNGHFSQVAAFSPTAHSSQPIPPAIFMETLLKYRQSTWSLACEAKIWQRNVVELNCVVSQLTKSIEATVQEEQKLKAQAGIITSGPSLVETSAKIQEHLEALPQAGAQLQQKGSALAAKLRGNMTAEKAANLRALLSNAQNQ